MSGHFLENKGPKIRQSKVPVPVLGGIFRRYHELKHRYMTRPTRMEKGLTPI